MFRTVCLRVTVFCLLLFAVTANAAIDGLVKATHSNLDNVTTRLSPAVLNDKTMRGDYYKTALAVNVTQKSDSTIYNRGETTAERTPFSRLVWGLACCLAFVSVMKRRLSR